jgi:hypothetical protein
LISHIYFYDRLNVISPLQINTFKQNNVHV